MPKSQGVIAQWPTLGATPAGNPPAGHVLVYYKSTDGLLYTKSSAGVESLVGSSGATGTAGGDLTGTYPNPTIAALAITDAKVAAANKDGVVGTASMRTLGTGAQQAAAGNHGHVLTDAGITGTLPIAKGGTNTTATPTAGGITYGTGTALAHTAAGTQNQVPRSNVAGAPTWVTLDLSYLPDAWVKKAVRLATTANINVTTGTLLTIDGVVTVAGDRVLVKNQTATAENGIYVAAAGAWTRATDADTSTEIAGASVNVDAGAQGGQLWKTSFKSTDTLGTTAMLWYKSVDTSQTSVANGVATLDGAAKVPIAQIPTGQTSTTVPLGNDSRFTDARTPNNDSNIVHKSTAETVTGVKTFELNTLVMKSGTATAYPWSNVSPPGKMTVLTTPEDSNIPSAGQAAMWTPDGENLYLKNSADKVTKIGSGLPPQAALIGQITILPGLTAPYGWFLCDGAEYPIATYTELYNFLTINGTSFPYGANTNGSGAAGSTHFRVPNIKGKTVFGQDSADLAFDVMGEAAGAKTSILGVAHIPQHDHSISHTHGTDTHDSNHWHTGSGTTTGGGGHEHVYAGRRGNRVVTGGGAATVTDSAEGTWWTTGGGGHEHNFSYSTSYATHTGVANNNVLHSHTTTSQTTTVSGQWGTAVPAGVPILPPYIVLNYMVRAFETMTSAGEVIVPNSMDVVTPPNNPVSFNNQRLTNLATPTATTDAATKAYVDTKSTSGFTTSTTPALVAHTWSANINHALNVTGVAVSAYEVTTTENIDFDWKRIDANNIQLRSGVAMAANSYVLYVSGR